MEIACIVGNGFEDSELFVPLVKLSAAGHRVTIIGAERGAELAGKKGRRILVEQSIGDANVADFDALLIPGGHSPDEIRGDERFVDFVKHFDKSRKLIAAICHGPQIILSARRHKGRDMTAWPTIQGDLRAAGARVVDDECVVDENMITSRMPQDLDAFCDAILRYLAVRDPRKARATWLTEPVAAR